MRKFDREITVSVSVAVLLPGVGSVTPVGAETLAVFAIVPSASSATVAVNVKVAELPLVKLTVVLMLPVPAAAPQLEPFVAVQVHVALVNLAGNVSTTGALVTLLGPLLVTTIV
jgi:hypothetical protein